MSHKFIFYCDSKCLAKHIKKLYERSDSIKRKWKERESSSRGNAKRPDSLSFFSDAMEYCMAALADYVSAIEKVSMSDSFKIAPHTILDFNEDIY